MTFKCKICDMKFEEEIRFKRHKEVHDRKHKVYGYGDPKFDDGYAASAVQSSLSGR